MSVPPKPGFIPFFLFYNTKARAPGTENEATVQAKKILDEVRKQTEPPNNRPMVGITYSANDKQITPIRKAYTSEGTGISGIGGSNQAMVMAEVEKLLATPLYSDLKKKFRILPITTTHYGSYKGSTHDIAAEQHQRLVDDFRYIDEFIKNGGLVLGWQNQNTIKGNRYAIGGGVTKLDSTTDRAIQTALRGYAVGSLSQEATVAKTFEQENLLQQWLAETRYDAKKQTEPHKQLALKALANAAEELFKAVPRCGDESEESQKKIKGAIQKLNEAVEAVNNIKEFDQVEEGRYSKRKILLAIITFGASKYFVGLREEKTLPQKKEGEQITEKMISVFRP